MDKHKQKYDMLLKNGELLEIFPTFKGVWAADREEFIQMDTDIDEAAINLDVLYFNTDDEDDE